MSVYVQLPYVFFIQMKMYLQAQSVLSKWQCICRPLCLSLSMTVYLQAPCIFFVSKCRSPVSFFTTTKHLQGPLCVFLSNLSKWQYICISSMFFLSKWQCICRPLMSFYLRCFSESRSSNVLTPFVCPSVRQSVWPSIRNTFGVPNLCNL